TLSALSLAYLRAGQPVKAIEQAEASLRARWHLRAHAQNWLVMALAHHALGHADESRRCLDEAINLLDGLEPGAASELLPGEALRHEAESLIPPRDGPAAEGVESDTKH